jgi:hypothetical protein
MDPGRIWTERRVQIREEQTDEEEYLSSVPQPSTIRPTVLAMRSWRVKNRWKLQGNAHWRAHHVSSSSGEWKGRQDVSHVEGPRTFFRLSRR